MKTHSFKNKKATIFVAVSLIMGLTTLLLIHFFHIPFNLTTAGDGITTRPPAQTSKSSLPQDITTHQITEEKLESPPEVTITDLSVSRTGSKLSYVAIIDGVKEKNGCHFIAINQAGERLTHESESSKKGCSGSIENGLVNKESAWQITFTYSADTIKASSKKVFQVQ